ncbi:bifunctional diaminohydroxyphosphoribosylaminopyrimidine deaminase/5-amino-6-(5-phosphoribosylamino)uracil reductase RibD [Candidatus Pantoea edessiphila]|uniref:Riboflavin biosynthesis protein RibD n=1 Tax=Candidatus Pantoea edessiphila TaxID=2044610 RepID=A0A2P5SXG0_9GAMM|nr:bifunctional diaminohydroxyphosphoribosylaminopyrimidine deaminase/5-amino-6-(5-phosphoribosylamino)uracil reductase RibD [Candidatus Pantoea edessiphila]MBK4775859.1 bifunctional diaminohydroxyphosphoribosylaminopyrimidine deaminase/5-amino-6-(5-phosphoribosylamino)uracil reductase RibD [Pantoea sp. Edef]PPI87028.1 bifunctional diaminohydroxyphosphoribosylaminopyrimidine deaminase/5-amino-6-(5-phosphoribosylamino)uracil reductase RibD [Candidatus Pantoea edessiphila]
MPDKVFMSRALKLAKRGMFSTAPNPNVGCVIVNNGNIVGEGWHQQTGKDHAEIHALKKAGSKAQDSTVYVTLEPCCHYGLTAPCCYSLIKAGVNRIVCAVKDPNPKVSGKGLSLLQQAGITVNHGLMMKESKEINRGFFKRMHTGHPWLQLKLGTSLDGRIAMNNGESKWITSQDARNDAQLYRAQSSAIISTSSTVLADDPCLTVRWSQIKQKTNFFSNKKQLRQPLRVIIDRNNRITPKYKLINQPGETWLIRKKQDDNVWPSNVIQIVLPDFKQKDNLSQILSLLGKHQINNALVEAGGTFAGTLIQSGLIDELIIYIAPKILGGDSISFCTLSGLSNLKDVPTFLYSDVKKIGNDIRLILIPVKSRKNLLITDR